MTEIPLDQAQPGDILEFKRGPREIVLVDGCRIYLTGSHRPRDAVAYERHRLRSRGITHAHRAQEAHTP